MKLKKKKILFQEEELKKEIKKFKKKSKKF